MRTILWTTTLTIVLAATLPSGPAAATTTGQALGLCLARGTDCTVKSKADGGYSLCVNNTGGQQCVNCPPLMGAGSEGSCSVAKIKGRGGRRLTVDGIFKQPVRRAQ